MAVVINGVMPHVRLAKIDEVDKWNSSEVKTKQEQVAAEA